MQYKNEIDGLRAIAVCAVIINHISHHWLPSGFLGVDVFFIISGFVVTSSLLNSSFSSTKELMASFYSKRIKRLFPALYVVVLTFSILALLFLPDNKDSIKTGMYSLFGLSNLFLLFNRFDYFSEGASYNLFTHTWSLGVEEQFYLIYPLLLIFLGLVSFKDGKNKEGRGFLVFLVSLSFLSYLYTYFYHYDVSFYFMLTRFWQLSIGGIIYLYSFSWARRINKKEVVVALNILLLGVFFVHDNYKLYLTISITIITSLLLILIKDKELGSFLGTKPFRFLGKISYSLYLWHWPMIVVAKHTVGISYITIPIVLFLTFVFSAISYYIIETPLRLRSWGSSKRTILLGTSTSFVLIINLWFFYKVVKDSFLVLESKPKYVSEENFEWNQDYCMTSRNRTDLEEKNIELCAVGGSIKNAKTLFVFGDSFAEQLLPVFHAVHHKLNVNVFMTANSGCPIWNGEVKGDVIKNQCNFRFQEFKKFVTKKGKKGDIIYLSNNNYWLMENHHFIYNGVPLERKVFVEKYKENLDKTYEEFLELGLSLHFVSGVPTLKTEPVRCIQKWSFLRTDCNLNIVYNEKAREAFLYVTQNIPRLDLFEILNIGFSKYPNNYFKFLHNTNHLSIKGATLLEEVFLKQLSMEKK